jgi:hypothetical protein
MKIGAPLLKALLFLKSGSTQNDGFVTLFKGLVQVLPSFDPPKAMMLNLRVATQKLVANSYMASRQ